MREPIALWVVPVSNLAGVARHVIDVARVGLPGFRLVVMAPEGPLLDELRALGCPVMVLDLDQPLLRGVAQLRHDLEKLAPAVVHSHLAKADFLVAMASAGLPAKLISSEHHIPEDPLIFHGTKVKAYSRQVAHHARIRRFAQLIAVSESTRRDMERYWRPRTPVTVVLNGIDRPQHQLDRAPGLRVLSLARLSPEKNVDMALRAFAKVRETRPEATLTIGGAGDEENSLKRLAGDLGLGDAVRLVGFVDPALAMATHDVLVQLSRADNLSYTLLDATANGLGVVASNIGGNGEIVGPQCLVSLGDIDGAAAAIIDQGLHLDRRPTLPAGIPTVAQMAEQIVAVYARAGVGRTAVEAGLTETTSSDVPAVSVVIAYYRNAATLRAQLDALAEQIDPPSFEVIIADNEGSTELPLILGPYRERLDVRVVDATDVRGQCHARNVGVSAARAEILGMCDADDVVAPTWLRALHDAVRADDVLATGDLQLDAINPEYVWRSYIEVGDDEPVERPVMQGMIRCLGHDEYAVGCNIGIRRSSYLQLSGMDESMLGGSEDVDFSWRAKESGRPIAAVPGMIVHYRLRPRLNEVFMQRRNYQRSQLYLWSKSRTLGRPVQGMSLRWAVTEAVKIPGQLWTVCSASVSARYGAAARAGAVFGNLVGQLEQRGPVRR